MMNVVGQLIDAIRSSIRQAPKSRETLAGETTVLSRSPVNVHQVNDWTAESHPHKMPTEIMPAFCQATGSVEPQRIRAEVARVFTMPGPDSLRAEIQKLDEEKRRPSQEKRKRDLFLKGMER